MLLSEASALFDKLSHATQDLEVRRLGIAARMSSYQSINPIIKQAFDERLVKLSFDTRRVDQENDRNPRSNLQYYHRSEPFIDGDLSTKISRYMKVKSAVDLIKEQYGTDPEWFDSYARVLSSAVDRVLRIEQRDGDFFKAAFDYLDELLYVRYRLSIEDITKMGEIELERAILGKDEKMLLKHIYKTTSYSNKDIAKYTALPTDPLIDRLLEGVKATADSKDVERSITISVRDKINDLAKTSDKS
jgi:hypothetical protein